MTVDDVLRELRQAAAALEHDIADEQLRRRLGRSVIRPLDRALAQLAGSEGRSTDPQPAVVGDTGRHAAVAERARDLAGRATRLRAEHDDGLPLEVLEAVAGLQDLAITAAPENAAARPGALRGPPGVVAGHDPHRGRRPLSRHQSPSVAELAGRGHAHHAADGPVPLRAVGIQAPVRRHARRDRLHRRQGPQPGSRPARHLRRPADHRAGQPRHVRALRVLHRPAADRLPARRADPFVAPSGGRMDEIIRAVRGCPSGALGLAVDERRGPRRGPTRTASRPSRSPRTGPTGSPEASRLFDGIGRPVARNAGASLEHYSLCRCGHSQNKPFCSGMHWYVDFRRPVPLERRADPVRVGRRLHRPATDDPPLLREARARGPAAGTPVRQHVAGSSRAGRGLAGRDVRRTASATPTTTAATTGWSPSTSGRPPRGAAGAVGQPDGPIRRRGGPAGRPRVPRRIRVLPRVGHRARGRELHARGDAPTAHAGAALVVGLRGHPGLTGVGARARPRRRRRAGTRDAARPRASPPSFAATSSRCSARRTASRCASPSTSGPTTT